MNIDVNRMLAEIYYHTGDFENANKYLNVALRTGSKDPSARILEAMLLARSNKTSEGERMVRQLFASIPYLNCSICKEAKSKF